MPRKPKFQHRKKDEKKKRVERAKPTVHVGAVSHSVTLEPTSGVSQQVTLEVECDTNLGTESSDPVTELTSHPATLESTAPGPGCSELDPPLLNDNSPLQQLHSSLSLPQAWCDQSTSASGLREIVLCKINGQQRKVTHSLLILPDLTWTLYVNTHKIDAGNCTALQTVPSIFNADSLFQFISQVDTLSVCVGQPDTHFVSMVNAKKGSIVSPNGKTVCSVDKMVVQLDGEVYPQTVRTTDCEIISSSPKCSSCKKYRATLRSIYHRWSKKSGSSNSSSFTNDRYLNTPDKKKKMAHWRKRAQLAETTVCKLKEQVRMLTENQGEHVDHGLHSDLVGIMQQNSDKIKSSYPEGSFARLLWDEQLKASSGNLRQMRWHPVIIKWCLNLKLLSSSAYHALRSSGFLKLPSERTLRDYTHYFDNRPGFQDEIDQQLINEIPESLSESKRYVALLIDEMKVKEGLVFNKHTGEIIGFTSLGDINDDLLRLEQECQGERPLIAKYILVVMVRGITFKLEFPYAHFGTRGATGDLLFPMIWEAIRRLEARELKVICVTADGASPNRKLFRMHHNKKDSSTFFYKTQNVFSQDKRWLYFISDPPHLIKTVRNCWSHSGSNGTRHMKVCALKFLQQCLIMYALFRKMGSSLSGSRCGIFMKRFQACESTHKALPLRRS